MDISYVNPILSVSKIIDLFEPIDSRLAVLFSDIFRYANKFNVLTNVCKNTYGNGILKQYNMVFLYYNPGCPFKLYVKEIVDGKDKRPLERGDIIISDTLKYTLEMTPTENGNTIYVYMQIGDTLKCHSLYEQHPYILNRICIRITHLIDYLQCYNNNKYQVSAPDDSVDANMFLDYPRSICERRCN